MNQLTKLNAAYIAGFLDGDGSIYVRVKPNTTYKYGFQIAPNIVFFQSQKEVKFLEKLKVIIGGGYIRLRNDGVAEYIIGDVETMKAFIKQIEPHLILKKLQANLLIRILEKKDQVKSENDFLEVVILIDQYKDLNYSKKRKNGFTTVNDSFKKSVTP